MTKISLGIVFLNVRSLYVLNYWHSTSNSVRPPVSLIEQLVIGVLYILFD